MKRWLAHLSLILSFIIIVLVILDYFNPLMAFLDNTFTHVVLLVLCGCSAALAVFSITKEK